MRTIWRDCQEWRQEGLVLSTSSNEACKLYDAALSQYVGWYEDQCLGGLSQCIKKQLDADPNFVMGKVLSFGLDLIGTGRSILIDSSFKQDIENLVKFAESVSITERERQHVQAIDLWAKGYLSSATDVWESILVEYPTDMLAVKMAHDTYFYLGQATKMRDSIARVLPRWKSSIPLYGYLFGMYAFGLVETNFYSKAETIGKMGLEINRKDAWSTHALAHVMEMTGQQDQGIKLLEETTDDWNGCGMLACHNFWHWALYHIEKAEYESALSIFDNQVGKNINSGSLLDLVDACSLLYRLELEGINVGDRWQDVLSCSMVHVDDHILTFNDIHFLMSCKGSDHAVQDTRIETMKKAYCEMNDCDQVKVAKHVGMDVSQAVVEFNKGNYESVVDILVPIRYKIIDIGGSNAQRDLFNLMLIKAALQSSKVSHHKLARVLLEERRAYRENLPMTDRLFASACALHA